MKREEISLSEEMKKKAVKAGIENQLAVVIM
jgi:hypothetical protein